MKIKNIIISQPEPANLEKSPYFDLIKKYNLNVVFRKFIKIEGITPQEFRRAKINMLDYSAVIFTCNNAVDHYFRLCKEMRITVPETTKYFCISEKTAYYLQKYVTFRKRKIFNGKENGEELLVLMKKHNAEKYLLPCTADHKLEFANLLKENDIAHQKAVIYQTISSDVSDVKINDFDMLVFFSPFGVKSLMDNFPAFKQNNKIIATWGNTTYKEAVDRGFDVRITGPNENCTSMTNAIEAFIEKEKSKK